MRRCCQAQSNPSPSMWCCCGFAALPSRCPAGAVLRRSQCFPRRKWSQSRCQHWHWLRLRLRLRQLLAPSSPAHRCRDLRIEGAPFPRTAAGRCCCRPSASSAGKSKRKGDLTQHHGTVVITSHAYGAVIRSSFSLKVYLHALLQGRHFMIKCQQSFIFGTSAIKDQDFLSVSRKRITRVSSADCCAL